MKGGISNLQILPHNHLNDLNHPNLLNRLEIVDNRRTSGQITPIPPHSISQEQLAQRHQTQRPSDRSMQQLKPDPAPIARPTRHTPVATVMNPLQQGKTPCSREKRVQEQ
ncbi:hypothetical protein LTR09_000269 [Extremus antarcticus]|uniref:Uncharacterized protein n=1 Tax=Extremus antarcticus TaxID=702011 RepID=A0AAJ0GJE2_9PEZI|nr:hypothetical protein LTR09_000269 [Extremus antarcticus]